MKSREQGGVVDSRLNVYGVDGLKIAGTLHSGSYCFKPLTGSWHRHVYCSGERCSGKRKSLH